jgi:hypothetical protein
VSALPPCPSPCILWPGVKHNHGYGTLTIEGKTVYAHRWVYEIALGPIPKGLELDHLCHVPACVNPWHLEPVTHRENMRRGFGPTAQNAKKTICKRGHPLSSEEASVRVTKTGRRQCRRCHVIRDRARRSKA